MYGGTTGDALDARDVRVRHQRNTEIDDAHVAILREHDIRRLDVAVNHTAGVCVVQRLRTFEDDLNGVIDAQQIVGTAIRGKSTCTVHVLGHDIAVAVFLTRIVDGKDVRMLQHADEVRFGKEHLARDARTLLIAAGLDVVDLNGDVAAVVGIVRQVHDPCAAAADLLDHHVLTDLLGDLTAVSTW